MKTSLNEQIAIEFFGWRWLASMGRPVRGTPGYGEGDMMVRQFFPPDAELDPSWVEYFAEVAHVPATGNEPLAYCYCSSAGYFVPPLFSSSRDACARLEKKLHEQGLLFTYASDLARTMQATPVEALAFTACDVRCPAALRVRKGRP